MAIYLRVTLDKEVTEAIKSIATSLKSLVEMLSEEPEPGPAVSTKIVIGHEHQKEMGTMSKRHLLNNKRTAAAPAPVSFPQLATDGALLIALDANGNVVPNGIDPTKTTVAWNTSDLTVLTVSVPDPADTTKALLTSTGKAGDVTVTATPANNDGSTPLPPATSGTITVPVGPPTTASIVLGTPTTP